MEFDLSRIDYTLVDKTSPGCLKLLPAEGDMLQQKIVIGDCKGVLQCFSLKNEEPFVGFKTLPGKEITSIQLAGAIGTPTDKIFVSSGNEVRGYTKKGKVFFSLETATSEKINSIFIHGNDLIIGSANIIIHYRDIKEAGNYICEDRVIDLVAASTNSTAKLKILATLATKCIVLLENNNIIYKLVAKSGPSCLMTTSVYGQTKTEPLIFYGAKDGSIGMLSIEGNEVVQRKLVEGQGLGSVSCVSLWEGPASYLLIGRHDGSVQAFLFDRDNLAEKPRVKFSYFCGEAVTSVVGGYISNIGVNELLVSTYSGRLFGLRPNDEVGESQKAVAARMAKLEMEITKLEKQVLNEREKYQKSTRSSNDSVLSVPPLLSIDDNLTGMNSKGWQELSHNSIVPIDIMLLYCKQNLLISTESAAIISLCPSENKEFIATVRCQAGTMQLSIKIKPESRPKSEVILKVYVIPNGAPRIARLKTYSLGCLIAYSVEDSLESTVTEDKKPWCSLNISGSFSAAEMSSWLTHLLPGEIPRPSSKLMFVRKHSLTGTAIICQYQRASALFRSEDISAIYILKSALSNVSINKNIPINMSTEIYGNYLTVIVGLIEQRFKDEFDAYSKRKLKECLNDLDIGRHSMEETKDSLCKEYLNCLNYNESDDSFEIFVDVIINWFRDYCDIQLKNYRNEDIDNLRQSLLVMNIEEVLILFKKFE